MRFAEHLCSASTVASGSSNARQVESSEHRRGSIRSVASDILLAERERSAATCGAGGGFDI
jgi:hypothetical protein